VHSWLDGNNVPAGIAAGLAGVPRIIISERKVNPSHFDFYESYMDPAYKALLDLPQVTMLNNSYAGRDDYARWLDVPPGRIEVIHNGCDFVSTSPGNRQRARAALGIPADTMVVGTVSRFSEEKRPQLFVETARLVLDQRPGSTFVFFGLGSLRDAIEEQIGSLGLSDRILLPEVTENVWESLAIMDIFLLTSRMEGLPNVLIQAQGAGLPVVCTAVGGMPETYIEGKTGFGIMSAAPDEFAAAVMRLIDNGDLRRSMSESAKAFARKEFDLGRMIARTLDVYRRSPRIFG